MDGFDPLEYKLNSRANWNAVASDYHYNWASQNIGPFGSTAEVVKMAEIKPSDKVLDMACGTGVVSKEVFKHLGRDGLLVGLDLSRTALSIAKKSVSASNANFIEMDAENTAFRFQFDKVLCQYGVMFFPNAASVLETARKMLTRNGKIVLAVHGKAEEVPYFSSIMSSVLKYIPDIRPKGVPTVHRFGNPDDLKLELQRAGFVNISIERLVFSYNAGTFDEYWKDYMHSTANAIRPKIESMGENIVAAIKSESEQNASSYLQDGSLVFPWTVLLASALP